METNVFKRGEPEFNICGQVISRPVHEGGKPISQKLAGRLFRYARTEMDASGFSRFCAESKAVEVYTIDGELPAEERSYCVRWAHPKGGSIEVVGIFVQNGKPFGDHGFEISR